MLGVRTAGLAVLLLIVPMGPGRASAQGNTRIYDVVYGRKFGMALTMDVWQPGRQSGVGVIFVVSGAFKSDINMVGSPKTCPRP